MNNVQLEDIKKFKVNKEICDSLLEYSNNVNWLLANENPKRWIYDIEKDNLEIINFLKTIILKHSEEYLNNYRKFDSDNQIGNLSYDSIKFLRLTKYENQSYFPSHIDVSKEHDKDLTIVIYLNDKVCSIEFPTKNVTYINNKSDMLIFPSYFNFPHVTHPVDFEKIVLVCWIKLNLGSSYK